MATTSSGPVKRGMRDYTFNLDGVNEQHIDTDGDFFHVQNVSVGGVNVLLRFDDGPAILRQQGEGNRVYYSRISLSASAACQVTVQAGYGYATDSRATITANITTPISPALHNPALAQVVALHAAQTAVIAADPNRLGVLIGSPSTNTKSVYIGDGATANGVGFLLEPGCSVPIFSQDALTAFNPDALVDVTLTLIKFMKT